MRDRSESPTDALSDGADTTPTLPGTPAPHASDQPPTSRTVRTSWTVPTTPPPSVAPALSIEALDHIISALAHPRLLDVDQRAARLQVQLLHNRGMRGAEGIRAWLGHDTPGGWLARPADRAAFPDLERAVDRVLRAVHQGERIVIFGDYDADGMTSCALLTEGLRLVAARSTDRAGAHQERIAPYLPTREDDGRGLNLAAIDALGDQGVTLILTTDCGTANVAEVARAQARGIDVIVTDHHPPHGACADAYALVNPNCAETPGPSGDLAGVGVAFRFVEAMLTRLDLDEDTRVTLLEPLLDLVAIGTIGDVVPLTEQSWMLARAGLRRMRRAPRPGVRALLNIAGVDPSTMTERDISFALAPRLNAASRLGNPRLALDLLLCTVAGEAQALARKLDDLNIERRLRVDTMLAEARGQLVGQQGVLFVVGEEWPTGMLGLVASRLAEEYGVPAFALGRKGADYRGSGRAPEGHDLGRLLEAQASWFSHYGGHRLAAGFTLPAARLDDLRAYVSAAVTASPTSAPTTSAPSIEVRQDHAATNTAEAATTVVTAGPRVVDCVLPLARATLTNAAAVAALAPYGARFPEPCFLCPSVRILRCWRSGADGQTLRMVVEHHRAEYMLYWPRHGAICDDLRMLLSTLPAVDLVFTLGSFASRTSGRAELSLRLVSLHEPGTRPT